MKYLFLILSVVFVQNAFSSECVSNVKDLKGKFSAASSMVGHAFLNQKGDTWVSVYKTGSGEVQLTGYAWKMMGSVLGTRTSAVQLCADGSQLFLKSGNQKSEIEFYPGGFSLNKDIYSRGSMPAEMKAKKSEAVRG